MNAAQEKKRQLRLASEETERQVAPIGYCMEDPSQRWRDPVIKRLNELVALQQGWDGYVGLPVMFENAHFAVEMLESCCRSDDPTPQIVPGTNGDLQIEWHLERGDIELHILAPNNVHAWHSDEHTGLDGEEVLLTTDFHIVLRWIKNITEPTCATVAAASR